MDYQDGPNIKFDERWKKNQMKLKKILEAHDTSVEKRNKELKKSGYTDEQIDDLYYF